jgi:hypothetical protein
MLRTPFGASPDEQYDPYPLPPTPYPLPPFPPYPPYPPYPLYISYPVDCLIFQCRQGGVWKFALCWNTSPHNLTQEASPNFGFWRIFHSLQVTMRTFKQHVDSLVNCSGVFRGVGAIQVGFALPGVHVMAAIEMGLLHNTQSWSKLISGAIRKWNPWQVNSRMKHNTHIMTGTALHAGCLRGHGSRQRPQLSVLRSTPSS